MATRTKNDRRTKNEQSTPLIPLGILVAGGLLLIGAVTAGNGVLVVVTLVLVVLTSTMARK
jgi:hypothetical protein